MSADSIGLSTRAPKRPVRRRRKDNLDIMRSVVAYTLLGLFAVNTFSVLTMIFLVGAKMLVLSDGLILTLIGNTVAQAGAIFLTITRGIFSVKER